MKTNLKHRKFLLLLFSTLIIVTVNRDKITTIVKKEFHKYNLNKNPYSEAYYLSKKERFAAGLPPNKYNEQMSRLSMDPILGIPNEKKLFEIQEELRNKRLNKARASIVPGESAVDKWYERGPNNVGGRTKAMMFDPNDSTDETVFTGGVTGGLYKNTNISDPNSQWVNITNSIPENVSVTAITYDPNDTKTFYVGTGESYTSSGPGNGLWKSTDGGVTWNKILGGFGASPEILFINDVVVRNNSGTSEVYVAAGFRSLDGRWLGLDDYGLYRSTNGKDFTQVSPVVPGQSRVYQPMDIEISPSTNKVWFSTTGRSLGYGGGTILVGNSDGTSFEKKYDDTSDGSASRRMEMEIAQDGTIYAFAATSDPIKIIKSTDEFATAATDITLPNPVDTGQPDNDFTRGQSFYDLMIETSPGNSNTVFTGGIDLYRSNTAAESGSSNPWDQISKWSNNNELRNLNVSFAHADQHGLAFANNDPKKKLFGNDGGVFYSLTEASGSETMSHRNFGLNVTQIYTIGVAPKNTFKDDTKTIPGSDLAAGYKWAPMTISGMTDVVIAGLQDNGTQLISNNNNTTSVGCMVFGGDGAASFFSQNPDKRYFITNYVYNDAIRAYSIDQGKWNTIDDGNSTGDFINTNALDSNKGYLYANHSSAVESSVAIYYDWDDFSAAAKKEVLTNALLSSRVSALSVSPHTTDNSNLYVGTRGGNLLKLVVKSPTDVTWTDITSTDFVGSVSDIEFGKTENELFVTFHNYGVKSVFYSADGGTTWSNKEGNLPDIPVRCILQNPVVPEEVILGTELGTWRTQNFSAASPTWTQSNNGMTEVRVTDLDLRDDFKVFAGTYGRGIFSGQFDSANPVLYLDNVTPNTLDIKQAQSGTFKLDYMVFGGYDKQTNFVVTGAPDGTTFDFTPTNNSTINTDGEVSITINVPADAPVKTYDLVVDAKSGGSSVSVHTKTLKLTVVLNNTDDLDGDGIKNDKDNCPNKANPDQKDSDGDGIGDVCDDSDGDGIFDDVDNCVNTKNADQKDLDGDGIGDVCDDDRDGDGIKNDKDNCPDVANADQKDSDGNGIGDVCDDDKDGDGIKNDVDNCINTPNPDQADLDKDGLGDVCDDDKDGDGVKNDTDNCPITANANQSDIDSDGIGDLCDDDMDNDTILNANDNCPKIKNTDQKDFDGDGLGDACDPNPVPNDTFSIKTSDETCKESDNGIIELTIKGTFSDSFGIQISGGPTGFSFSPQNISGSTWSLKNLKSGNYWVCLTSSTFSTLKQCFNANINEPKDIDVSSIIDRDNKIASLDLDGGSNYNITINGNLIKTSNNFIDLALSPGINIIEVKTDKDCQGVYEETIFISEDIMLSPNPVKSSSTLWVGGNDQNVNMTLFDITGKVIWTRNEQVPYSRSVNVPFSNVRSGLYILKVDSETIKKSIKVIKE